MIKSIPVRIYPNKTQLKIINDTLYACHFVKNKFLEYNLKNRDEGGMIMDRDENSAINIYNCKSKYYEEIA